MQIVSDQGMDLSGAQRRDLKLRIVPMQITLDGQTYLGSDALSPAEFYRLLQATSSFPTTSQPSPGDFAQVYRELAQTDPEILSIHISSGLSGTFESARLGATMVPEAHVTLVDTKTLSLAEGWQVQAAAQAVKAGWALPAVLDLVGRIREATETLFTLADLKYLIHGGRISHLKGLMGSVLKIKPMIGVTKDTGKYASLGQEFSFSKAILHVADLARAKYPEGTALRVQFVHGDNPEGVALLQERMAALFRCHFDETIPVAPLLGAHTGPTVVGMGVAPLELFQIPGLKLLG